LITGAGGSIGVELCRQVAGFSPKELVFLDRDETGLQLAQFAIENSGLLDTPSAVLADIRDGVTIRQIFETWRPEIVFHAGALKHVSVLERYPEEAWKTNVIGTLNVLNASSEFGVEAFINISTDKAADPSSVLGKSKRIAEELTAWVGSQNSGSYVSVRFGNVLGSRGSLVPTVAHLIESGGPVTVTHPDATRYFMTIPEACQLVLQAGVLSEPGFLYVLDMGEPVRIIDVINRMIEMSGKKIEIIYTGLRAGEKLHEVLFSNGDSLEETSHPLIFKASVTALSPAELERLRPNFNS
jgi:dTDP-glucose 4,6-dehydratase